jgi:hypothetical protein
MALSPMKSWLRSSFPPRRHAPGANGLQGDERPPQAGEAQAGGVGSDRHQCSVDGFHVGRVGRLVTLKLRSATPICPSTASRARRIFV